MGHVTPENTRCSCCACMTDICASMSSLMFYVCVCVFLCVCLFVTSETDEQPELLAKFSKIRKWSADEIKAAEDSQNAGSTSPQQYQNTAVSSSGMNAGRQLVSVKQHPAVPASEPSGDQSRGRRAVASSPAATKLPTSPDYVNVAPFVKPKSSRGGPVTIEPLSPGSSTPASRLVLNRQASEPAADVPPAVTQTSKKPVPLPAVGSERTGTSSRPLVPPKPLMPERDAAADGQEKKWHASSSVAFVNPMHRAKSATSLIPDSRGLVSVGDDVPPELPTGRRGHALARVVVSEAWMRRRHCVPYIKSNLLAKKDI